MGTLRRPGLERPRTTGLFPVALALLAALSWPRPACAQIGDGWEILKLDVSRARLEELLADVETELSAGHVHDDRRAHLGYRATVIRTRLTDGDFRSGDHVWLEVEGVPELTDTFTVVTGPLLRLPVVGDITLHGVLGAELEPYLTSQVGRVLRTPRVRAHALVQLSILGEVTRPGFYLVTPDALLTEALMSAGGPTQAADFGKLRIERGPASVWSPDSKPTGPIESYSVNELGLRTGDRILIPAKGGAARRDLIQIGILGLTALVALFR